MLDDLVPEATSGNRTSIQIAAPPERVWKALNELTVEECRLLAVLMAIRSIPAAISRRGGLSRRSRRSGRPRRGPTRLIDSMTSGRFLLLHSEPPRLLVLGIVGQFWRPSGGDDAGVSDIGTFREFDQPGYVKSAVDFLVEPTAGGSRLSTETRNQPTDARAARLFGRYWRLVGWGSKVTRLDLVRAVKRRAERGD